MFKTTWQRDKKKKRAKFAKITFYKNSCHIKIVGDGAVVIYVNSASKNTPETQIAL